MITVPAGQLDLAFQDDNEIDIVEKLVNEVDQMPAPYLSSHLLSANCTTATFIGFPTAGRSAKLIMTRRVVR